ncbi:MAG: hypothetical protein ACKO7A_25935 [Microcystis sp.]
MWDLYFFQTNTQAGTFTQLAGSYTDRYEKRDGRWQIGSRIDRRRARSEYACLTDLSRFSADFLVL